MRAGGSRFGLHDELAAMHVDLDPGRTRVDESGGAALFHGGRAFEPALDKGEIAAVIHGRIAGGAAGEDHKTAAVADDGADRDAVRLEVAALVDGGIVRRAFAVKIDLAAAVHDGVVDRAAGGDVDEGSIVDGGGVRRAFAHDEHVLVVQRDVVGNYIGVYIDAGHGVGAFRGVLYVMLL